MSRSKPGTRAINPRPVSSAYFIGTMPLSITTSQHAMFSFYACSRRRARYPCWGCWTIILLRPCRDDERRTVRFIDKKPRSTRILKALYPFCTARFIHQQSRRTVHTLHGVKTFRFEANLLNNRPVSTPIPLQLAGSKLSRDSAYSSRNASRLTGLSFKRNRASINGYI